MCVAVKIRPLAQAELDDACRESLFVSPGLPQVRAPACACGRAWALRPGLHGHETSSSAGLGEGNHARGNAS